MILLAIVVITATAVTIVVLGKRVVRKDCLSENVRVNTIDYKTIRWYTGRGLCIVYDVTIDGPDAALTFPLLFEVVGWRGEGNFVL